MDSSLWDLLQVNDPLAQTDALAAWAPQDDRGKPGLLASFHLTRNPRPAFPSRGGPGPETRPPLTPLSHQLNEVLAGSGGRGGIGKPGNPGRVTSGGTRSHSREPPATAAAVAAGRAEREEGGQKGGLRCPEGPQLRTSSDTGTRGCEGHIRLGDTFCLRSRCVGYCDGRGSAGGGGPRGEAVSSGSGDKGAVP